MPPAPWACSVVAGAPPTRLCAESAREAVGGGDRGARPPSARSSTAQACPRGRAPVWGTSGGHSGLLSPPQSGEQVTHKHGLPSGPWRPFWLEPPFSGDSGQRVPQTRMGGGLRREQSGAGGPGRRQEAAPQFKGRRLGPRSPRRAALPRDGERPSLRGHLGCLRGELPSTRRLLAAWSPTPTREEAGARPGSSRWRGALVCETGRTQSSRHRVNGTLRPGVEELASHGERGGGKQDHWRPGRLHTVGVGTAPGAGSRRFHPFVRSFVRSESTEPFARPPIHSSVTEASKTQGPCPSAVGVHVNKRKLQRLQARPGGVAG